MKELPHTFASSAALGWAFCWRNTVLVAAVTLIQRQLLPELGLLGSVLMFVLFIGCSFVAAHWVRSRGFGSVKVILVEWADYQEFKAGVSAQPTVQPDGPLLRRSRGLILAVGVTIMKPPIIEVRKDNLFVLPTFNGALTGSAATTRHNLRGNHLRHLIDSDGAHWSLTFQRTNHSGVRKALSALWNISSDFYTVESSPSITIENFRKIIEPHLRSENPDFRDLATSLIESVARCPSSDAIAKHIPLLNL